MPNRQEPNNETLRAHSPCQCSWLHERFAESGIDLRYEMTHRQAGDIYTKAFYEALLWIAAYLLINVVDGRQLDIVRMLHCTQERKDRHRLRSTVQGPAQDRNTKTIIHGLPSFPIRATEGGHSKASLPPLAVVMLMTVRMPWHSTTYPYTEGIKIQMGATG